MGLKQGLECEATVPREKRSLLGGSRQYCKKPTRCIAINNIGGERVALCEEHGQKYEANGSWSVRWT